MEEADSAAALVPPGPEGTLAHLFARAPLARGQPPGDQLLAHVVRVLAVRVVLGLDAVLLENEALRHQVRLLREELALLQRDRSAEAGAQAQAQAQLEAEGWGGEARACQ
jgi:hypothetical protein